MPQGVPDGVLITEGVFLPEEGITGNGEEIGVWPPELEAMWGELAGPGGPLMTEDEGAGDGVRGFWDGTMPGNTGVIGVVG